MLRVLVAWMPVWGAIMQTASAVYIVVTLRRHIHRAEKDAAELHQFMLAHMHTVEGHLVELVQMHGRVEDLELVVFGERR